MMDTPKTLLFVDDTPAILKLLEAIFKPRGYASLFARHGREAVQTLQAQTVDLIILDLDMPIMNGYEFLAYLQKYDVDVPVIVVTATKVADHEFLDDHGVTFMEKPFLPTAIVKKVEELLEEGNQLRGISLASFLQLLGLERKSAAITVSSAQHQGVIYMKKGEMIHATTKRVKGEAALYLMLKWPDVKLEVDFNQTSGDISIDRPLEQLLLDIFRMQDEHEVSKADNAGITEDLAMKDSATNASSRDNASSKDEVDLPSALLTPTGNPSSDVTASHDAPLDSGAPEDGASGEPDSYKQYAGESQHSHHSTPTEVYPETYADNITLTEE
ncbi:MAG: response regulator, partial [Deinococcota bacterium]